MKQTIKQLVFSLIYRLTPVSRPAPIILMYHSIGHNRARFTVTPEAFERQMSFLKSSGRECFKLSEFTERLRSGTLPSNAMAITFDDGYEDNFNEALPILKRYSIQATIFVLTGSIGKELTVNNRFDGQPGGPVTLNMMNEDQVKKLSNDGLVECMPHGHSHGILRDMSREDALKDISQSKQAIEGLTGKPAVYFAYPYGKYSNESIEIVSSLKFQSAVSVKEGVVDSKSNLFELPRMAIASSTSMVEFKCKVAKPMTYLAVKRLIRRKR